MSRDVMDKRNPFPGPYPEWFRQEGLTFFDEERNNNILHVPFSDIVSKSLMSRYAIERAIGENRILIDPFDDRQMSSNSYDIRLGEWYWRERGSFERDYLYNPYDEKAVRSSWKLCCAKSLGYPLTGIPAKERVIIIDPGETLLCHTEEFIGSMSNNVVAMMRGRSTTARNRIKICSDAGLGDIGYCNRWTMEVTNFGKAKTILVVGRRLGQIEFFETEPIMLEDDYVSNGKYQSSRDLDEMKKSWKPEDMLPKQWLDWEVQDGG